MNIWRITLVATSDFHTAGDSKGSTVDYLRDAGDVPYIPGTHVKGVMRSEAERILRSVEDVKCWVTGDPDQENVSETNKRKILTCEQISGTRCDVYSIFGSINDGDGYIEGKIRVTDFNAVRKVVSASRMHVSIDRDYMSNRSGGLYRTRVVPRNTSFMGHIITRDLTENEEKLLWASLHSMCHYGLGGERSRGLGSFDIGSMERIDHGEFLQGGIGQ